MFVKACGFSVCMCSLWRHSYQTQNSKHVPTPRKRNAWMYTYIDRFKSQITHKNNVFSPPSLQQIEYCIFWHVTKNVQTKLRWRGEKVLFSIYMYYTPGSGDILVESTQNNNNNTATVTVNMFISPPCLDFNTKNMLLAQTYMTQWTQKHVLQRT